MKRYLQLSKLFLALMVASMMFSCASTEKLLDEGRYEDLVRLAEKKLSGKKKKKLKYVVALEEAFAKIQDRDGQRILYLKESNEIRDWEKLIDLVQRVGERQEALEPFLPLVADNGYQASFNFIKVEPMIKEAKDQIASMYYNEALDLLEPARNGSKGSARSAYTKLLRIEKYFSKYEEKDRLKPELRRLGIVHVAVETQNHSEAYLPSGFEKELFSFSRSDLNHFWIQFHMDEKDLSNMDYKALLSLNGIMVSPESFRENRIRKKREIEDGFRYVLDENGNVAKDTLGNDIKEPNFIWVKGSVLETEQLKSVTLMARVELVDLRSEKVIESEPVIVENEFYHKAMQYFGDERAFKHKCVNIPIAPFPSDLEMIWSASDELKPSFIHKIKRFNLI